MSMKDKTLITFAGAVGSSKTPIAHFLSLRFGLPIFNNDAIRTEVLEDLGVFDEEEYKRRRDTRLKELAEKNVSFITKAVGLKAISIRAKDLTD